MDWTTPGGFEIFATSTSTCFRQPGENIPQLLVREEELFTELQQPLQRARSERIRSSAVGVGTAAREHEPPTSPSRSPTGPIGTLEEDETASEHRRSLEVDFFGDDLRGYRLLKAAKLTTSERQHILTLTTNSTRFIEVRRALRTLFAEENVEDGMNQRPRRAVWFQDSETWGEMHYEEEDQEWSEDWWSAEEDAY